MLKENCVHCFKVFPLHILRTHVLSRLSSHFLQSDNNDEYGGEFSDQSEIAPEMSTNLEIDSHK